jgi:CRISPR-associated endonuclease Cas1
MAASLTLPHSFAIPQISKLGVLTLYGFGIRVRMQSGHLEIEDGIGAERRKVRLPRVGHRLKRLVCIGNDGFVTLSALEWLSDQNASFVMLERNGKVHIVTGPVRSSDAKLRRSQALAFGSDVGLHIARELISRKLCGQERTVRNILLNSNTAEEIARVHAALPCAESLDAIRVIEAQAAATYWRAWYSLPIMFPTKSLSRVPEHWRKFGTRKSLLSGSPRLAVNPPNAMLNLLYSLLEAESRLAATALGLDPGLGILHMDTTARDSLACDLMEAVRPEVDAYLLHWTTKQRLNREWFFEQPDGNCRLTAAFARRLCDSAPIWACAVSPIAEWVAQQLWASTRKRTSHPDLRPTRLTQRRKTEGRGKDFVPSTTAEPKIESMCRACGARTRGGEHCRECSRELWSKAMIERAKVGRVVALSADSRRKRSETQMRHGAARREWRLDLNHDRISEEKYQKQIQPKLASVAIGVIARTLGVSVAYAAQIRAGRYLPHPRHWPVLAQLAGATVTA